MKDLNLNRLIPVAAAGSMLFGGCSKDEPETVESYLTQICEDLRACDEEEFEDEYGSVEECAEYILDYMDEYYDIESKDCEEKFVDALKCFAESDECQEYAYEECENEFEDFFDDCADDTSEPDRSSDGEGSSEELPEIQTPKPVDTKEDPGFEGTAGSAGR